jgi:tetratricopeptide (TPR) repeat protein
MKKPIDAKLDRATAREVCLRDGAIKGILTGRVEKIGTNYVLSVQIVDPARDIAVASYAEEDPADTLLASTVRRLAGRVRESLGEEIPAIQQSDGSLEKATTPSLRALQLYTQAERIIARDSASNKIAAGMLEQALTEDPDFASAHMLLGYAYSNLGRTGDSAPHFRRAFELADRTTERERYFILASYYGHPPIDQPDKAAEIYETLLRRYPDHRWALNNLANLCIRLGKAEEYDDLRLRLAALRPNDLQAQLGAGWVLVAKEMAKGRAAVRDSRWTPDFRNVQPYLDRAVALRKAQTKEEPGITLVQSPLLFTAELRWMEGRVAESRASIIEMEQLGKEIEQDRPYELAPYLAAYGNLHEAERRAATEPTGRSLPLLAYFRGDRATARGLLRKQLRSPAPASAGVLLVDLGFPREGEAALQKLIKLAPRDPLTISAQHVMEGELALARGDRTKGANMLDSALATAETGVPWVQMASEDLARAYEQQGRRNDAVRVLERAAYGPTIVSDLSAMWQERVQWKLAQLYRRLSRTQDAERVEALLRTELAFADPDHPILLALHNRRQDNTLISSAAPQMH